MPAPTVTCLAHQGHTYFNKATPTNSATPYEIMGANHIQTSTHLNFQRGSTVLPSTLTD